MQELPGHADVSTTMNICAHATWEAKRALARLLDKVVKFGDWVLSVMIYNENFNKRFESYEPLRYDFNVGSIQQIAI